MNYVLLSINSSIYITHTVKCNFLGLVRVYCMRYWGIILASIRWFSLQKHSFMLRERVQCLNFGLITWGLFDRASSSWNNLKCQIDAIRSFYWCILSSTCFGYIHPSSEALDLELHHMAFCTEFLDGWWSWEPLRRSCVRCGWCRATHGHNRTVHTT